MPAQISDVARQLIPTPRAQARDLADRGDDYHHNLEEWPAHLERQLLPTPTAWEQRGTPETDDRNLLPLAVQRLGSEEPLLPTPTTPHPAHDSRDPQARADSSHQTELSDVVRLLPTPMTSDGQGGRTASFGKEDGTLPGVARLLPTPRAAQGEDRNNLIYYRDSKVNNLENALAPLTPDAHGTPADEEPRADQLLPTPNPFHLDNDETVDGWLERRADVEERTGTRHGPALPVVALSIDEGRPLYQGGQGPTLWSEDHTQWGPYEGAVRRWESVTGRPAPQPTEPGKDGRPRLSPRFVEWLMGLPAGWVTEVPELTRNEQLKALGNGVVPQQAAVAVAFLLSIVIEEAQ